MDSGLAAAVVDIERAIVRRRQENNIVSGGSSPYQDTVLSIT